MFCSLSVPWSLLGYAPLLLDQISHDTIIVAPFSELLKCVKIMLFGVVFMEKNTKNKQHGGEENLSPHISITGALYNIPQMDSERYSAGLQ